MPASRRARYELKAVLNPVLLDACATIRDRALVRWEELAPHHGEALRHAAAGVLTQRNDRLQVDLLVPHAGAPLPGRTPAQVLSQLSHRMFGPLQPTRIGIVLDYHGLLGYPAGALVQIAARHHLTSHTVANSVAFVRAAGHPLPLSAPLIEEPTRLSAPGKDHLGRVRTAATLGLPAPRQRRWTNRYQWRGAGGANGGRPRLVASARRGRPA